uniref:Fungal lipase-type domain-containing protein n=1 Tax=viral metagenome TaxID=1070528 RepID=A0A6C0IGX9_9ZZZZ
MDIPLISHICSVLSRLSYMNNTNFLHNYIEIFKIPEFKSQLHKINTCSIENIFEPKINNISIVNKKINTITKTRHTNNNDFDSSNIKYISISTSNYSSVYIIADKLTNSIFISFRGTYSVKSALSYLKLTSIEPYKPNKNSNNGILLGIFKIVGEIYYTICESIYFLSKDFLKSNNYKLFTTGHSLGGGCAQIFSYLLVKNKPSLKITCVTFGGPRTMNKSLITKYNNYIENKVIMFRRYVTNGDPIPLLPFTTKSGNNSYYHTDDDNEKMSFTSLSCKNVFKTNKVFCNLRNKTQKIKPNPKYHSIYLGVYYKGAGEDLFKTTKEIVRHNGDTVCKINVGGNNESYKAVFFLLDDLKMKTPVHKFFNKTIKKIKKIFTTDYKHQDIYMNREIFNNLIKNSVILEKDNLNPTKFDKLVKIEHTSRHSELYTIV